MGKKVTKKHIVKASELTTKQFASERGRIFASVHTNSMHATVVKTNVLNTDMVVGPAAHTHGEHVPQEHSVIHVKKPEVASHEKRKKAPVVVRRRNGDGKVAPVQTHPHHEVIQCLSDDEEEYYEEYEDGSEGFTSSGLTNSNRSF